MILSKLTLQNFKKYKHFTIELQEGLIGIIGKNGSGKSTLFEAILFALYGELKSRGTKELIRNANATSKDVVSIELLFEIENHTYRIVREFRGKALTANAKLYKNEELITSGAKEVTASIVKLTKLSKDAFVHTLFASQKELTSLSTLKNEERKRMIRRLLGLERIDFIEKELIERSRELKREIAAFHEVLLSDDEIATKKELIKEKKSQKEKLDKTLLSQESGLKTLQKEEKKCKSTLVEFQKTKEHRQKLIAAFELSKNSVTSEQTQLKRVANELEVLSEKAAELKSFGDIQTQYERMQTQLKELEKLKEYKLTYDGLQKELVQLREQYTKAKSDINTLERECKPYQELVDAVENARKSLSSFEAQLQKLKSNEQNLLSKIAAEQKQIELTDEKIHNIQNLGRESACPTCTRPLLEEYDNVINSLRELVEKNYKINIEHLQKELNKVTKEQSHLQIEKAKEEKSLQKLSQELHLIQSKQKDLLHAKEYFIKIEQKGLKNKAEMQTLQKYHYDAALHTRKLHESELLKPKYEQALVLQTQLKRSDILNKEQQTIEKKIKELHDVIVQQEKELNSIQYDNKAHEECAARHESLIKEIGSKIEEANEIKVQTAEIEGVIKSVEATLKSDQTQRTKLQKRKDDLLDYEKIKTSLTAFKSRLNAKIAPRISSVASQMYSQITKGKYQHIEVNNEFDFFIYDGGKKYPIERFSGGEIDLANLVLRIAISKTLTELSGASSVGFLAFDEVFGSQDESRRVEILEAFHTIKEQYRQIFLISHEMEIKEMFEQLLEL